MSVAIQSEMIFTPMMVNDVLSVLKNKSKNIKDQTLFITLFKLLDVARDELKETSNQLELAYYNPENYEVESLKGYESIYEVKENLYKLHDKFENSNNVYEIQIFEIVDQSLDYISKILNLLSYLDKKVA